MFVSVIFAYASKQTAEHRIEAGLSGQLGFSKYLLDSDVEEEDVSGDVLPAVTTQKRWCSRTSSKAGGESGCG